MLLKLGDSGSVDLVISIDIVKEIESVIKRKSPDSLGLLALLMDKSGLQIVLSSSRNKLKKIKSHIAHLGDALILASAISAKVDFFVTADKKHFLSNKDVKKQIDFPIGSPGDFLSWFRDKFL